MANTVYLGVTWQDGNDAAGALSAAQTLENESVQKHDFTVANATTDKQVAITVDAGGLEAILIKSDQDLTLETNNATTPDHTITITANVPFAWWASSGITNPFDTTDVTTTYWTNAGATTANVYVRILQDSTP